MKTICIQTEPVPGLPPLSEIFSKISDPTPSASSSSSTETVSCNFQSISSNPDVSSLLYSDAITTSPKQNRKNNRKNEFNMTPFKKQPNSHVMAHPAPVRDANRSRSAEENMEVSIDNRRSRPGGGGTPPKYKKKAKYS
ncbi:hypothetical protein Pmani_003685 [Petrolisthes manimaculis]|uniref:Uncharacterized protein n=1 Tax=Petrolisthes manimaculis TaxID=1843537 RepID=A0AAE1UJ81_9EUCA|nr:hypothetical protein Pmani_003685 [Petrolisthes manimaculis]